MSDVISSMEQQLKQLQQLMAAEAVELEKVQALMLQLNAQVQQLDGTADPQQAGEFLLMLQQWLQQSQQKLEIEKQALAENLRNVQKGRAGTQVYQTLR
ncbi:MULTISPECIES: hypothetical protein [Rheinheimera]|uniref:Flagellar protein FliT n=1 Tax=Rheinheimera aquimaris TaxID=412437 RepID=A0ABN1D9B3_9GAMM|nr:MULTISPECIES: hypothetical protein [Rheinheimera]MCB5212665.1 hypothetical protein [Rheinheimera aquimaris]MCD1599731.1 hypothetical protein [Rheinheimera aquimaris]